MRGVGHSRRGAETPSANSGMVMSRAFAMAATEHQLAPVCAKHLDLAWFCFPKVPGPGCPRNAHPKMLSLMFSRLPRLPWERASGSAES